MLASTPLPVVPGANSHEPIAASEDGNAIFGFSYRMKGVVVARPACGGGRNGLELSS